jgi:dipeptidyl aminopeptidase/acylaminoacyl peptidase
MTRKKVLSQDDIFKAKFVNAAALSPDGRTVAYVLSETIKRKGKEKQSTSIWLGRVDGRKPHRLTRGAGSDGNPVFTKNGSRLLFLSSREKPPQIYSIEVDGGEAEAVTSMPQGAGAFKISPDGKWLAFASTAATPLKQDGQEHQRINRAWYRFDPVPGYLHNLQQAIYLVRVSGGKPKAITPHKGMISALEWSPDSKEIAFTETGLEAQEFIESDLNIVSTSGNLRRLVSNQVLNLAFWTKDGSQVGIVASPGGMSCQSQLLLINCSGGKRKSRTARLDLMVGGALQIGSPARPVQSVPLAADGKSVFMPVSAGGEQRIYRVALSGKEHCEILVGGPRVCHLLDGNDNHLLYTSQDFNTPPELFSLDLSADKESQLTDHNQAWHANVRWPDIERIVVKSAPGIEIEGWVLTPKHLRAPYKTLLCIHGGPHAGFGYTFNCDYQELVGAGYAIVIANPRGSTGYGDKFSKSIVGCWGEPETRDFNALLDHLVKRGISDKDRLGVTGVSGGGHLSGWLIGHTRRFKAAVPEQGVYNMLSMWGTSDAGKALIELEMQGPPHRIGDKYWQLSPLAHAHKCKTPTLLIQGENDIRCPMEQAEQMFAALEHHGCPVELLRLKNCSHGAQVGGDPALRRYRMNAMKDWFDRHIK